MRKIDYVILISVGIVLVLASLMIAKPYDTNSKFCRLLTRCDTVSMNNIIAIRNVTGNYTVGNICASLGYANSASCARYCGCQLNGTSALLSTEPLKSYSDNPVHEGVFIVRK